MPNVVTILGVPVELPEFDTLARYADYNSRLSVTEMSSLNSGDKLYYVSVSSEMGSADPANKGIRPCQIHLSKYDNMARIQAAIQFRTRPEAETWLSAYRVQIKKLAAALAKENLSAK